MFKSVAKIVHSNQRQAHSIAGFSPGVIVDPRYWLTVVCENIFTVFASLRFNHTPCDSIQHDNSFLAVLGRLLHQHRETAFGRFFCVCGSAADMDRVSAVSASNSNAGGYSPCRENGCANIAQTEVPSDDVATSTRTGTRKAIKRRPMPALHLRSFKNRSELYSGATRPISMNGTTCHQSISKYLSTGRS